MSPFPSSPWRTPPPPLLLLSRSLERTEERARLAEAIALRRDDARRADEPNTHVVGQAGAELKEESAKLDGLLEQGVTGERVDLARKRVSEADEAVREAKQKMGDAEKEVKLALRRVAEADSVVQALRERVEALVTGQGQFPELTRRRFSNGRFPSTRRRDQRPGQNEREGGEPRPAPRAAVAGLQP